MADPSNRDGIGHLLVKLAMEARSNHRGEAASLLLDAAGAIIVDAQVKDGYDAGQIARNASKYLVDQVLENLGPRHG